MQEWVLFEDRKAKPNDLSGLFFQTPIDEVICWEPSVLCQSLACLDNWKRKGYYLAGFASYEAGYALQSNPLPMPSSLDVPLLHFYVFKTVTRLTHSTVEARLDALANEEDRDFSVETLQLATSFDDYHKAFLDVKRYLLEGDTYQVNLTSKYRFQFTGSPVRLYQQLRDRQRVMYSGILCFHDYQILTLSPELFFSKQGSQVCVKPMKGTMPRADDPILDEAYKALLCSDEKSRAENIMIVDLLRNDLSAIAIPGTLNVSQLLHVESYETVHQMTSSIECQVDPMMDFGVLMRSLFPCGSITGAPKRRTMELIQTLEPEPRRIYTGAIGYILPNNDMCFNVAIRTLLLQNGRGELGVGGGIVYDSDARSEFQEMQLKGRFFTDCVQSMAGSCDRP